MNFLPHRRLLRRWTKPLLLLSALFLCSLACARLMAQTLRILHNRVLDICGGGDPVCVRRRGVGVIDVHVKNRPNGSDYANQKQRGDRTFRG
jgi:hypothetical protein